MTFTDRLQSLGLEILPPPSPIANFRNFVRVGSLVFLSGQGPREADGRLHTGKVGTDVSVEEAYQHARLTGLNLLSVVAGAANGLNNVRQIVKLLGFVNAASDFTDHPAVINGCSDLFVSIFGDAGHHARSAIGVGSLPNNISVEIEAIFELNA
ncbi:hypothetical protein A6U86_18260 [Rhizobium sp. AC27/96]|uniref:RidA family protein n=1 Tax=Rhizobium sp. AC27/96 TaxID=1841653 RepID=UPI000827A4D9|nr:RidA family protein [Rhizobium sp. AC27/96]OCI93990.1 hypothetical protein A6U86_18260 [Rhizobium sp. AC27/96]